MCDGERRRQCWRGRLQVFRRLAGGEMTTDDLEEWYAQNRHDTFAGTDVASAPWLQDLPDDAALEVEESLPEGRLEELRRYTENALAMEARRRCALRRDSERRHGGEIGASRC